MLVFAGLSHRLTPLAVRERCAVPTEERATIRAQLCRQLGPVVLLSTCGRLELYADAGDHPAATLERALGWLAERTRLSDNELAPLVETATGADAVRRLVRVACGLESALEGEDEVLGQVRRAWLDAGLAGELSPSLDAAFRLAVRSGRQARRFGDRGGWTSLAETAAAHVALAVAEQATPRVLIAGTGPMGMRAALALRGRFGPELELLVAGRTPQRVTAHAAQVNGRPLTLADVPYALDHVDAALVGLRTRAALIAAADVTPRSAERPLTIVDLSVPRAVEPAVGDLPGVRLRDVDHLTGNEGRHTRWSVEDRARVERLVAQAVCDYTASAERSDAITTLTTLRMQADGVRRAQLARTLRRLPELDDEARWAIDALTRAIVNRLLHTPTMRLKADTGDEVAGQVRELFGLAREA